MKCYIVRHASKEKGEFFNSKLNHQDQPLSQIGIEQSKWLMDYFRKIFIDEIFVSQYIRTSQTVKFVAESKSLKPQIDDRLNELDNGSIDGLNKAEIQEKYPKIWAAFNKRNRDFKFPDGESGKAAQARIVSFLDERLTTNPDQTILAVSHDGLIRTLMCYILGKPVYHRWNFKVDTCGITEIEFQPDYNIWKLIRFNQTLM